MTSTSDDISSDGSSTEHSGPAGVCAMDSLRCTQGHIPQRADLQTTSDASLVAAVESHLSGSSAFGYKLVACKLCASKRGLLYCLSVNHAPRLLGVRGSQGKVLQACKALLMDGQRGVLPGGSTTPEKEGDEELPLTPEHLELRFILPCASCVYLGTCSRQGHSPQVKSLSDLVRQASIPKSMTSDTGRAAGKILKSRVKVRQKKPQSKRIPMLGEGPAGIQETAICPPSALPVARCGNSRGSTGASVSGRGLDVPGGVKRVRLSDPLPPKAAGAKNGSGQKDRHRPDVKPKQGWDGASARSRSPPRKQDTEAVSPSEESSTSRVSTSASGGEFPNTNLAEGDSGKRRSRASGSRRSDPPYPFATSVGGGPNEQPMRAKPRGKKNRRTLKIKEPSADDVVKSKEPSERLRLEGGEHQNAERRGNDKKENRRGAGVASNAAVRRAKWLQAVEENDKRLKAEDERLHLERERIRKERVTAKEAHVARSIELMKWMVDEQGGKHDNLGIEGPAASGATG